MRVEQPDVRERERCEQYDQNYTRRQHLKAGRGHLGWHAQPHRRLARVCARAAPW